MAASGLKVADQNSKFKNQKIVQRAITLALEM
jgi:hypothetical protein